MDGTGAHYAKGSEIIDPWKDYIFPEQNEWNLPDIIENDDVLVKQILQIKKDNQQKILEKQNTKES